jgi:hypothetical protein
LQQFAISMHGTTRSTYSLGNACIWSRRRGYASGEGRGLAHSATARCAAKRLSLGVQVGLLHPLKTRRELLCSAARHRVRRCLHKVWWERKSITASANWPLAACPMHSRQCKTRCRTALGGHESPAPTQSQQGLTNTTKASAIKAYADELLLQARNLRCAVRRRTSTGRAVP